MKRIAALILAMLMVLPMAACGDSNIDVDTSSGSSSGTTNTTAEYTIKVGHTLQEDTPSHKGFLVFKAASPWRSTPTPPWAASA